MQHASHWKTRLTVYAGVAVLGLATTVAVAYAATGHKSPITKFTGVDEVVEGCTNSTSYTNMPNMKRSFILDGSDNSEAVVMFSGSLSLGDEGGSFDTGFIRLTVDGSEQTPGEVPAIGVNDRGAHAFNFQTASLAPGTHTARIQWRTDLGSSFCVDARSLTVLGN
jgi:hypothetical protein